MADRAGHSAVTFPRLSRSIAGRFTALSRQHQQAARYLLDHPEDVALLSMRQVAAAAKVQPATMLRLARALDFDGYPALRRVFVDRLRHAPKGYSRRAQDLQGRDGAGGLEAIVGETFAGQEQNLRATLDRNGPDRFQACAKTLEAARTVYILGLRSCFPLAFYFHYVYHLFRDNSVLLDGLGGTFPDDLRRLGPRDALLAMSLAPYTRDTVRAVEFAAGKGVAVLAVTDSQVSPLARHARHTLLFAGSTPSFFHSLTAAMAILEALLAVLAARGGRAVIRAISESEAQLSAFAAYWRERRTETTTP